MNKQKFTCPICGYDGLDEPAYDENGIGTFDICPCCFIEFGSYNETVSSHAIFDDLREKWIHSGAKWHYSDITPPKDWDPFKQLNNLEGYIFQKNRTYGPYAEIQYCENKTNKISHWKSDSLYIDIGSVIYNDIFYPNYSTILNVATLPNGKVGFDPYGENYYSPEQTKAIYEQIEKNKNLPDRIVLLNWLKIAVKKNIGFYILGA